jgi:hypothetical protein
MWKRLMAGMCLGMILLAGGVKGAEGDAVAETSTFDNAAYDYWKACALIQEILTEAEFEFALFTEQDLPNLPPKSLAYQPGAGRWLLNERLMLEELHAGAGKPSCVFLRQGEATAQKIALYRGAMSRVILRALASAKAHEFVENRRATGSIYADLLRLLRHLDENGDWAAVDFTLGMLPAVLRDIEGFLTRQPPRDVVEMITRELDAAGVPRFPIQRMLEREASAYSSWLLENPSQVEAKVGGLYGDAIAKPALNELLGLDPAGDEARVREWIDEYQAEIGRLGAALALPYPEAIQIIRETDGMVAGVERQVGVEGSNPLLPLLMPPMARTYERFVAAEAHLAMVEVLCKGAIYGDFVGGWPDSIDVLDQFAGGTLPPDPFTGQPVGYDLRGALPRVQVDAPKHVRDAGAVTEINLRQRVQEDDEALAALVREMQRKLRMEETQAKQREKASGKSKAEDTPPTRGNRSRVNRGLAY